MWGGGAVTHSSRLSSWQAAALRATGGKWGRGASANASLGDIPKKEYTHGVAQIQARSLQLIKPR